MEKGKNKYYRFILTSFLSLDNAKSVHLRKEYQIDDDFITSVYIKSSTQSIVIFVIEDSIDMPFPDKVVLPTHFHYLYMQNLNSG